MKRHTHLILTLAALALAGATGLAQTTNATNAVSSPSTNVFRVSFAATCQSFDSNRGRIVTSRLTERNIIAQAVGASVSNRSLTRNFALVYNADEDSLQVVDTNLAPVVDVLHFGGGSAIADGKRLDRFTFLFLPGQTNQMGGETNVIGSAVITERTNRFGGDMGVPNITGRLQFVLTGSNALGMTDPFVATMGSTNSPGATNSPNNQGSFSNVLSGGAFVMTNSNIVFDASARICLGTFSTTRGAMFGSGGPTPSPAGGGTNGISNTNSPTTMNTNRPGGATGATGNTTGSGVVGINTTTGTTTFVPITGGTGAGTVGGVPGTTGIIGTTGTGAVGSTATPTVTGTANTGTINTGTGTVGVGTTGVGVGAGATPTGSGSVTTGVGTTGGVGTTTATGTTTTGTPIVIGR